VHRDESHRDDRSSRKRAAVLARGIRLLRRLRSAFAVERSDAIADGNLVHASRVTPQWIDSLMRIRNRVVRLFGLKDVGAMAATAKPSDAYQVGDRIGIFSIFGKTENELLLGIDDRHLDVRVSVMKSYRNGLPYYVVSTVVHVHNLLGHLYMVPVGRIHPFVVKSMMRRAEV
jgi:hypothetical protein